jgi:AcrR family transcriptional regulator
MSPDSARRSEKSRRAIYDAALALVGEVGYPRTTIEGIAARAGVGKQTIYRWWSSKAELVMEAYGQLVAERMPAPDSDRLAEDLTTFVTALYRVAEHPARVRALRGLMAEAQLDPVFAEAFRGWVQSRRDVLATLFTRAVDRGEVPADLDVNHAVDLVFGPFWYRLLVEHLPVDPAEAPGHVRRLLHGLSDPTPQS